MHSFERSMVYEAPAATVSSFSVPQRRTSLLTVGAYYIQPDALFLLGRQLNTGQALHLGEKPL
ncbi:hypothetical protein CC2G_004572 [Coprinopsis cinerea AmutBmut pab1-1]|nr:hypothetical protein CC2G_004572 [Coprinopsis cinerea AmutBmut pab1-1]